MNNNNVQELKLPRSDAVKAQELRGRLDPLLIQVCQVMADARSEGLMINFNIVQDPFGMFRAVNTTIVKPL